MNPETHISSRPAGMKTIIDIEAQNVDFRNCESIKSAIANIVSQGESGLLLNLEKVNFMDSSGLSVILFCKRACEESGGTLGMFGLQGYVSNLVQLTRLNKAIPVYDSEEAALS